MSVEAAQTQYRQEMVMSFEQRKSLLSATTTKETVIKGNTATFLVAGSGGDTAVTRGQNGQIPYGNPTNSQVSTTLVEKHAPYELTGFNVFASQGNQLQVMQDASMAVINRDMDLTILAELANASQDYGSGTATLDTVLGAQAILGVNDVDTDEPDNMFCVITPAFKAYLAQTTEFASGDYAMVKPFAGGIARKMWRWADINWITSSKITGIGTDTELCYMYHRKALGYACNIGEDSIDVDYDRKQQLSWSNATIYHSAKILQDTGIVKITHDGSAFAAT